jgi:hypothetical protein
MWVPQHLKTLLASKALLQEYLYFTFKNILFGKTAVILMRGKCMSKRKFSEVLILYNRLCGLVVRVLGYRSGGPGSIPGTTRKKKSSRSGTGSTQLREYN